jgi:hypothetical protein
MHTDLPGGSSNGEVNTMFYSFLHTTQQDKINMFSKGVNGIQMKKWLVFS